MDGIDDPGRSGARNRPLRIRFVAEREENSWQQVSDLLRKMLEMVGSDLHITTNSPPQIRVHGHLQPLDMPPLTPAETKQLAYSVLTDAQKHRFEENLELDFSFGLKGLARFRGNLFNQRGATGGRLPRHPVRDQVIPAIGACRPSSASCARSRADWSW